MTNEMLVKSKTNIVFVFVRLLREDISKDSHMILRFQIVNICCVKNMLLFKIRHKSTYHFKLLYNLAFVLKCEILNDLDAARFRVPHGSGFEQVSRR